MKSILCTLLAVCFSLALYAIDGIIVTTLDYQLTDKINCTMSESIPMLSSVTSVCKKQYFYVFVFYNGFQLNQDQKANIEFDLRLINPKGKVYFEQKQIPDLDKAIGNAYNTMQSPFELRICFEKEDPYGDYQIIANIRDLNAKSEKMITNKMTLCKAKPEKSKFTDEAFGDYFENYYKDPMPGKAIDAFLYYSNSKLSENENTVIPLLASFVEIFNHNEYLIPLLYKKYPKQSSNSRALFICLLCNLKYDSSSFFSKLNRKDKAFYEKIKDQKIPVITGNEEISSPTQLDILWAQFYASGSYTAIRQLVETLKYVEFSGSIDQFKNSGKTKEDQIKALKEAIYKAAAWSIKSHYNKHPLVKDYCDFMYEHEALSESVKTELGKIINGN